MKLLLACVLCLTVTYGATEMINCIYCYEGDQELYNTIGLVLYGVGMPVPPVGNKCSKDNMDSTVTSADNTNNLCTKIDVSGTLNGKDSSLTIRTTGYIGKCNAIEPIINSRSGSSKAIPTLQDAVCECNQCDEEKCNSATSIQMSLVLLVSSLTFFLMRS